MKTLLKLSAAAMLCLMLSIVILADPPPCAIGKMPIGNFLCQPPLRDPGTAPAIAPSVILALLQALGGRG